MTFKKAKMAKNLRIGLSIVSVMDSLNHKWLDFFDLVGTNIAPVSIKTAIKRMIWKKVELKRNYTIGGLPNKKSTIIEVNVDCI